MNSNNYKLLAGDASFRKFYRSSQNSIIVFSKKNKYLNLAIYDAINSCLIKNGVKAPKLKKEFYNKNFIEIDNSRNIAKFHPLFFLTQDEIKTKIEKFHIPYNPLHDKGYPSIGCSPCTRAIRKGEHFRAGRWWWEKEDKKECGLHQ